MMVWVIETVAEHPTCQMVQSKLVEWAACTTAEQGWVQVP